jgi:hypothetical protein
MKNLYFLLINLTLASLAFGDVSTPSGTQPQYNSLDLSRNGLYKVGAVYLADDDANEMLLSAPTNLAADNVAFVLPSTNGTANQCLATDGSGFTSWVDVVRPGLASIVNADVAAAAAIARTKLASGTASHVLINNGSGVMSSEAQLAASRGGTGVNSTATFPTSGVVTTNDATATIQNKTLDTTNTIRAQDTLFEIWDDADSSKKIKFNATNLSTSTTRTYGVPNADVDLIGTSSSQTLTNKTINAALNTVTNVNLMTDITGTLGTTSGGTGVSGSAVFPSTGTVTTNAGVSIFTNKTFDANGTGNSLSNVEVADIAAAALTGSGTKLATDTDPVVRSSLTLQNTAGAQPVLKLSEDPDNGTNTTTIQANASIADYTLTLPVDDGNSGEVLSTNGTGALSWVAPLTNPMDSAGDLIVGGSGGTATKLDAGTTSQVLIGGTSPTWGGVSSTLITDGTIVSADINASAAIPYSKLSLGTSIVNADISGSAAIDGSKLVAASASVAGAVTTGTQTFAGVKNFNSQPDFIGGFTTDTSTTAASTISRSTASTSNVVLLVSKLDTTVASSRLINGSGATDSTAVTRGYIRINSSSNNLEFEGTSDRRVKKDIQTAEGLSKILALHPVTFKMKADNADGQGFIAQEFAEVFPSAVTKTDNGEGNVVPPGVEPWTMSDAVLIPHLVAAIKELDAKFEAYKAAHP